MRWFRLYNEIIDDPKIAKMNPKMFKFFIFLLCLASECNQNGLISLSKKELSWRLRMSLKRVNSYIDGLKELNIITENPMISFINWDKRQYKSDSSKERVQHHRNKKRNVTVTPFVTPPDTDTDTDTEKEIKRKFNQKEFEIFYLTYPNRKGKKEALERWKKLIKSDELPKLEILLTAVKEQILWRQNANGDFRPEWKNPATWLNKGCWEDEVETKIKQPKHKQPSLQEQIS